MRLRQITIRNSFYSTLAQIIMILLRFLSRVFLIRYIGVKQVGLSDAIYSIVGMLSLAEVGIGSAISYSLYTPLHDDDQEMINKIMNVFKRLYTILSGMLLSLGIIGSFFLQGFLKGININATVYLIYFLYVGNTCVSYLLCHRRTLLYADLKEYIVKRIDIATNFIFTVIGLVAIVTTHDIIFYILTVLLQTFVSNVWIHINSKKIYPYLKNGAVDKAIVKNILMYVKDLFWGTVASFVYGSTDNIIVSSFLGTVYVGYLGNYSLLGKSIQMITSRALSSITPTIGRLQRENLSKSVFYGYFLKYHQICYILAFGVTVPTLVLFDGFIEFVFGSEYLLMPSIKYLLSYILYVNIAASSYGNILTTSGEFRLLKQVEMIGAITNIVTSLLLVHAMGLPGVLVGTVITITVQWMIRSYMIYINCLIMDVRTWILFTAKEIYKITLVVVTYLCGLSLYNFLDIPFIVKFVICGCFCIVLSGLMYLCLYRFSDKFTKQDIFSLLNR